MIPRYTITYPEEVIPSEQGVWCKWNDVKPLVELLRESKREHRMTGVGCGVQPGSDIWTDGRKCTCGASEWNARVDALIGED